MAYDEIVLLLCGNFNPITNMHLRMFEIARDHLIDLGYSVYKGIISPFQEDIDGQKLIPIDHRIAMIKYALSSSDWIQLSTSHCQKLDICSLTDILQHHQTGFEFIYRNSLDGEECKNLDEFDSKKCRVIVKLLCGADILLFLKNSKSSEEVQNILTNHGVVVIARNGFDIDNIIYENDFLWSHRKNIIIVKDQTENQISCNKIRKAISRGRSIKYLVNDAVERYICLHNLYIIPDCEYKSLTASKSLDSASSYEVLDSFQEFTWHSHSKCDSSSDTLTNTTAKKSKLSHKMKISKSKTHFKNVDKSKLIEIPLTKDGVIQIIADKETNL